MKKHLSRFMRKTLMPDETFVAEAQFSWVYTAMAFFWLAVIWAAGVGIKYATHRYGVPTGMMPVWIFGFIGLWQFFWMMLKKWTTEIVLTDQRLIFNRGFFLIKADEVDIEQLASYNVYQFLLGRMLDYGEVHIRCIEASDIWLPPIDKPYEFRNAIEHRKHQYRDEYMKVQRLRQHGGSEKPA